MQATSLPWERLSDSYSRTAFFRKEGQRGNGSLEVQVKWGDALQILPQLEIPDGYEGIDLLLLDGVPKETLQYLRAAEPLLSDGAVVVADNAGACSKCRSPTASCLSNLPL